MGIDGVRLPAPRLEDYGDISHPGDLLCPSCGLVLMFPDGALGTLAVAAAEGVLLPGTAWVASEGGFGVIVPTGGPAPEGKTTVLCRDCGQHLDMAVIYDQALTRRGGPDESEEETHGR